MTALAAGVSPGWLALREPADAAARARDLIEELRLVPQDGRIVVHDLGCGTGSMARWLAPQLAGPQHWVLYDRDPALLARAAAARPERAADGSPVTVETRRTDITRLDPGELAGASLITASALLDMLTADELERVVGACLAAAGPVLFTLSVIGSVGVTPPDPLDELIGAAFNAHQRRLVGRSRLLGPDAVTAAAELFGGSGVEVLLRPSPWRLGRTSTELAAEWFAGWVGAACEQQPELTTVARGYLTRRLAAAAAGALEVTVQHCDLLARPR